MTGSTRNLLKVFGEEDHREAAASILAAIFGDCTWDLRVLGQAPTPTGVLLAAVHFESPAGPPITWVEELSRRMPAVTFELWADPVPECWGPEYRKIFGGGRLVDHVEPGDPTWIELNLPLAEPPFAMESPLDLVSITVATMNLFYKFIHDDFTEPLPWKLMVDARVLQSQMDALHDLLTPTERLVVDPLQERHAALLNSRMACQRAANGLRMIINELPNPYFSCRLDDEDHRAINRLRSLERSLDTRDYVSPSVNLSDDETAAS
jgi:hypothetical protein